MANGIIPQHRQERLSVAYVQAVAASAGFIVTGSDLDYGIDQGLSEVALFKGRPRASGFSYDIQLKATTRYSVSDGHVRYALDVTAYNDIVSRESPATPLLLVLLCLPEDRSMWLNLHEEALILRKCCYWGQFPGPPSGNAARKTVHIPTSQIFDAEAAAALMERRRRGTLWPQL